MLAVDADRDCDGGASRIRSQNPSEQILLGDGHSINLQNPIASRHSATQIGMRARDCKARRAIAHPLSQSATLALSSERLKSTLDNCHIIPALAKHFTYMVDG